MTVRALVLGAGMIGRTMARDLAGDPEFQVSVGDLDVSRLDALAGVSSVTPLRLDFQDLEAVHKAVVRHDIVLGALPSRFGYSVLETVIESGRSYADITFMREDALELNERATSRGVTAVVDCGVSPGLSNMMVGHAANYFTPCESAKILVGGLPKIRRWPFDYKAPFAPGDVIEEYVRPARFVARGVMTTRPALSDPELVDVPRVGTLEAFNTDGLRSLLRTQDIPELREKTLRYPGHIELMRIFRELGFFEETPIEMGDQRIRPLDLTKTLFFPHWTLDVDESEFTVLRVTSSGVREGHRERLVFDLYDEYDAASRTTSMARTTAFPCTIVARLLASGRLRRPGVLPPEAIGAETSLFSHVLDELDRRGVKVDRRLEPIGEEPRAFPPSRSGAVTS